MRGSTATRLEPDMARPRRTYLLLLSPHEPRGRRFVRLAAPSVFAWFVGAWNRLANEVAFSDELGGDVCGLDSLFWKVAERGVPAPKSPKEMATLLETYVYYERDIQVEDHFVHVETDDDEVDIEYFIFDDTFLEQDDALDYLPRAGRKKDRYAKFLEARTETDE